LGFSYDKKQFKIAFDWIKDFDTHDTNSSMLVYGYNEIHQGLERTLCSLNGFEEGIIVGSGFLANMALIESLVRKKDMLFIDEDYHASGMMATGLLGDRVVKFKHNDANDLEEKLKQHSNGRRIIAVEGVYSMSGVVCSREIFEVADRHEALLIVDEAHSAGVLGKKLLGVFEYHNIEPKENHIKMGTLGKAYGSYGAYILASGQIISFLENRAKPIIYSTAPSIFDTALALVNISKVANNPQSFSDKIKERQAVVKGVTGIEMQSLILPIPIEDNAMTQRLQQALILKGYLVGAIRQPTVDKPILRVIPRLGSSKKALKKLLNHF
jgi:8-amino-7-oxononanoate synthase